MADNMGNMTITSANSVATLRVPGLYSSPITLEAFATDAMVSPGQVNPVVVEMSVDGHLSAGFVPTAKEVTFAFAADSPSRVAFEDWAAAQDAAREVMACEVEFVVPAVNRKYTGKRGFLTAAQPGVAAGQTLQSGQFVITFESWVPSNL